MPREKFEEREEKRKKYEGEEEKREAGHIA